MPVLRDNVFAVYAPFAVCSPFAVRENVKRTAKEAFAVSETFVVRPSG